MCEVVHCVFEVEVDGAIHATKGLFIECMSICGSGAHRTHHLLLLFSAVSFCAP